MPKIYDVTTDSFIKVTQEWCDLAEKQNKLVGRIFVVAKSQLTSDDKIKEIMRMIKANA